MRTMPFLIALVFFVISSCAQLNFERSPATDKSITDSDVTKVFEFEKSSLLKKGAHNYKEELLAGLQPIFGSGARPNAKITLEFVEDLSLPANIAYFPVLQAQDNQYKIIILHAQDAIYDPVSSEELRAFLTSFYQGKFFTSNTAAFEMYYNAQEKDVTALHNLSKIRGWRDHPNLANLMPSDNPQAVSEELNKRIEEWSQEKIRYESFVKKEAKIQKAKDAERRAVIDVLDKVSEDRQFKTLIANNDRKGVVKLLRQYLPWEQMPPFEKRYWENHLQIIENPLPVDQRVLVYRGIDDDMIYVANEAGKALDKEEALKDGKVFLMSTMMTKNQGTWNRRLRSLTAMYEKFIATNNANENEFTKSTRISTMFYKHSQDPKGSPFLSLTPSFDVASHFGASKMSAYLLDPRAMFYNFSSNYKIEVEYLIPLMVFPDEVVGFYDENIHTDLQKSEVLMKEQMQEKLIRKYGAAQGKDINQKILKNSSQYFNAALNNRKKEGGGLTAKSEANLVTKFFSTLLGKKKDEVKPAVAPTGSASCMDLMSLFWK